MGIIIYDTFANRDHIRLKRLLKKRVASIKVEIFHFSDELLRRLHGHLKPKTILILMVGFKSELVWLSELYQNYLTEVRLIVVLPELSSELTSLTHRLFPRYLTDFSYDLSDVAETVENLYLKE